MNTRLSIVYTAPVSGVPRENRIEQVPYEDYLFMMAALRSRLAREPECLDADQARLYRDLLHAHHGDIESAWEASLRGWRRLIPRRCFDRLAARLMECYKSIAVRLIVELADQYAEIDRLGKHMEILKGEVRGTRLLLGEHRTSDTAEPGGAVPPAASTVRLEKIAAAS